MKEIDRIILTLKKGTQVSSLCGHGDEFVDRVGGVARYGLNGSVVERHINWAKLCTGRESPNIVRSEAVNVSR